MSDRAAQTVLLDPAAQQAAVDAALVTIDNRDEIVAHQFLAALHRLGFEIAVRAAREAT